MKTNPNGPPERATPQEWEQLRDSYIRGEGSLRRLAFRRGLPLSTVEARCRREGWVKLREQRRGAALEKVVGASPVGSLISPVGDQDWWAERDQEHLHQSLEVTRRLRQAIDKKIPEATATELEKLGSALEAVVKAEREILELSPRPAKNKAPSLRPDRPGHRGRGFPLPPPTPSEPNDQSPANASKPSTG